MRIELGLDSDVSTEPSSWLDVTSDVPGAGNGFGTAVTARAGRDSPRSGITPGSLSFDLENEDGRYSPRNTTGPYAGQLKTGMRVRVVVKDGAGVDTVRWSGFVSSGFAEPLQRYLPLMHIEAHCVLGVAAQGDSDWPDLFTGTIEAFDAGRMLSWWSGGATDWNDRVTGRGGRWTAVPTQTRSPIPGAGDVWVSEYNTDSDGNHLPPDGVGRGGSLWPAVPSGATMLSVLWDTDERSASGAYVVREVDPRGVQFYVIGSWVRIVVPNADGDLWWLQPYLGAVGGPAWETFTVGLHHLLVWVPDGTLGSAPFPRVWLDGQELSVGGIGTDLGAYAPAVEPRGPLNTGAEMVFGGDPDGSEPYWRTGGIVETAVWDQVTAVGPALTDFARQLWAATTRKQQTMDARLRDVMRIAQLDQHVSGLEVDASAITTLQELAATRPTDQLQQIEDTEQGRVYVDGLGRLCFAARSWPDTHPVSMTPQLIVTDDPALLAAFPALAVEPLEAGTEIGLDPLALTNKAVVNSTNGRQQTASNPASIAALGVRNPISLTNLLHATDAQSRSIAEWLVYAYSDPQVVRRIGFRVEDKPDVLTSFAAKVQEGWMIRIAVTTPAGPLDFLTHVIGIAHEWSLRGWHIWLDLDASRANTTFGKWDSAKWDTDTWGF